MKKLRAADSADAIVDGLRRRRTAVYVPSLLRPLSVLTSRCRAASSASSSARSAATRSPKSRPRGSRVLPGGDAAAAARAGGRSAHQRRDRRAARQQPRHRERPRQPHPSQLHARVRAQLVVLTHESGLIRPRPAAHGQRATCSQPIRSNRPGERPPDVRKGRAGAASPAAQDCCICPTAQGLAGANRDAVAMGDRGRCFVGRSSSERRGDLVVSLPQRRGTQQTVVAARLDERLSAPTRNAGASGIPRGKALSFRRRHRAIARLGGRRPRGITECYIQQNTSCCFKGRSLGWRVVPYLEWTGGAWIHPRQRAQRSNDRVDHRCRSHDVPARSVARRRLRTARRQASRGRTAMGREAIGLPPRPLPN